MSEQALQRQAKHRLAVIRHAHEVTGNVAPDVPVLRDQPADVLQLVPAIRGTRSGRSTGPLQATTPQPVGHFERDRRQDHPSAVELPLRAAED